MERAKTKFGPGDVIAKRYHVQRVLGRGGMGEVYLVTDHKTKRNLALKTLLPQYATEDRVVYRFAREVKTLRRLDHPSIVKIYDAQRIGTLLFYTMDYVHGTSVRAWLKQRGRIDFASTVRVLALVAHALEYAHRFTIHRDLSPDNVMVLADGSIRLLDFGLAKLTDSQAAFTRIGVTMGKAAYNSPEMLLSAADVDHRADLYSMGIMFFEMLAGRRPEKGDRLTDLVPELPKECNAFFEKATARAPNERFASALEFRQALVAIYKRSVAEGRRGKRLRKLLAGLGNLWRKLRRRK